MLSILFFLAGVVLSLILSFIVIVLIRKSYREIVEELCGTPQRAGYWIRASQVCLVVITAFVAITFHGYRGLEQPDAAALFWNLVRQLACILTAIFISLAVISLIVLRSLPCAGKPLELPSSDTAQD